MDQLHSTVVTMNSSSSPGHQTEPSWDSSHLVSAVMFSLCFSVGVPGNIAVIILRPNWEHLSSLSQSLMLNLAVSDLLCLLTLPLWTHTLLYGWTFGLVSCKLLEYFLYCSVHGSMLTVTGLSIQRYLVVVHRLKNCQIQKGLVLVLIWLVAIILSIPTLVVRRLVTNQQRTSCQAVYSSEAQWMAVLLTESCFGIVSFSVVTFSYIRLKKKINQSAFFSNPETNRLVSSIIVSLFILWVPYFIMNMLGIAGLCFRNVELKTFYTDKRKIAAALTFVNSCLNPLLYAFTTSKVYFVCPIKKPKNQRATQNPDNTTAEHSQEV